MRVVVHDYSGHSFQIQLSRSLARRGHTVLHLHGPFYNSGKGALARRHDDPPSFDAAGIELGSTFETYSPIRRLLQERAYGRLLARRVRAFAPDVVLSSNTPLFSQRLLFLECRRVGAGIVFWQQDIYSLGMRSALAAVPGGDLLAKTFTVIERGLLLKTDAIVTISSDFIPTLADWGVALDRVQVIENWAPLDEMPVVDRRNGWSDEHGLTEKTVLLYAGTLGKKHNPDLLLRLARHFERRDDVCVVVISEGVGSQWLAQKASEEGVANLLVLPFQPYERLPEVLGTGDVLLVILEPEAGVFAVPSKVLTYQSAARPILASLPAENLAARVISASESGLSVESDDVAGFLQAAQHLVDDTSLRGRLGANGRSHAVNAFDIDAVTDRFEKVLEAATPGRRDGCGRPIGGSEGRRLAALLVHQARRVTQMPAAFSNWPAALARVCLGSRIRRNDTVTFVTRSGTRLSCPNRSGARVPVFEVFAEDCYRLRWFLGPPSDSPRHVLDIGAHIGSFALQVAEIDPAARVLCYEASSTTATFLRRNIEENGLADRITVRQAAVSSESGWGVLADNGAAGCENGLVLRADDAVGARLGNRVATHSFDDVVCDSGGPVDLVKIDCEGAEYGMILTSAPDSWRDVRQIVLEYHPVPGHDWGQLETYLVGLGFDVVDHERVSSRQGTVWLSR
ncbi:MAG TPA: FkbM family methyltransferase [Acidimicrobiales bacterium]|nr:FkbM family methyltransferase [Acidimicrobiales bacterium]